MTQRITAQQIATACDILKSHGYFVQHRALQEAMHAALCSRAYPAKNESAGRPESRRPDMGWMYFGD